jgi:hypothetical protein
VLKLIDKGLILTDVKLRLLILEAVIEQSWRGETATPDLIMNHIRIGETNGVDKCLQSPTYGVL